MWKIIERNAFLSERLDVSENRPPRSLKMYRKRLNLTTLLVVCAIHTFTTTLALGPFSLLPPCMSPVSFLCHRRWWCSFLVLCRCAAAAIGDNENESFLVQISYFRRLRSHAHPSSHVAFGWKKLSINTTAFIVPLQSSFLLQFIIRWKNLNWIEIYRQTETLSLKHKHPCGSHHPPSIYQIKYMYFNYLDHSGIHLITFRLFINPGAGPTV